MANLNDGVLIKLAAYTGTANDRQVQWLKDVTVPTPPDGLTLDDYWSLYMDDLGFTGGTLQERIAAFMRVQTSQPALYNYNDLQTIYWNT